MIATRKAQLLDVVEVLEDLPQFDVKRGERGAVVEVFDEPEEAYIIEFVDGTGKSRIAYWVKPSQIATIDELAKEIFESGLAIFKSGNYAEAERIFKRAIEMKPSYLGVFHNSVINSLRHTREWQRFMTGLRLVLRLDPNDQIAQNNLAIAYMNFGIDKAKEGDFSFALQSLYRALGVATSPDIITNVRQSLAAVYTSWGVQAYNKGDFEFALRCMSWARENAPNATTRHNLSMAYAHLAYWEFNKRNFELAKAHFESAEDMGLVLPELLNDYGVTLIQLGKLDEAVRAFERSLELSPENVTTKMNLDLARKQAASGFSIDAMKITFDPIQLTQPQEYQVAA
ncbi:MAG: tetratricopeptide repeat protein [Blastocatellia bacterium]